MVYFDVKLLLELKSLLLTKLTRIHQQMFTETTNNIIDLHRSSLCWCLLTLVVGLWDQYLRRFQKYRRRKSRWLLYRRLMSSWTVLQPFLDQRLLHWASVSCKSIAQQQSSGRGRLPTSPRQSAPSTAALGSLQKIICSENKKIESTTENEILIAKLCWD